MKKIAVLLLFTALFSCTTDEANLSTSINGSWHLTSYLTPTATHMLPVLNNNDVVYNFDVDNKHVTIDNNVEAIYPFFKHTGTYSISGDNTTIAIDGRKYSYVIVDSALKISDNTGSGDGPTLTFER